MGSKYRNCIPGSSLGTGRNQKDSVTDYSLVPVPEGARWVPRSRNGGITFIVR